MANSNRQQDSRRDSYDGYYSDDRLPRRFSADEYDAADRRTGNAPPARPRPAADDRPHGKAPAAPAPRADRNTDNTAYDMKGSRNILIALVCVVAAILIIAALLANSGKGDDKVQQTPSAHQQGTVITSDTDAVSSADTAVTPDTPAPPAAVMKLPEPTPITDEAVISKLDSIAKRHSLFTAQIATIKDGEVSCTYEYGTVDKESDRRPDSDTKMRVASLSKVITGITAMSMAEKGILDLDAGVSTIAGYTIRNPYYPKSPITMRTLLCHTSTISTVNLDVNAKYTTDLTWLPSKLKTNKPYTKHTPGKASAFEYSNSGYCIAGYLQEKAAGKTLNDYLHENFLDRMGIDAAFCASQLKDTGNIAALRSNEAKSYGMTVDLQLTRPYYGAGDNSYPYAGDYMTSAKDFARMLCILINDGTYNGTQFLSAETVSSMLTHQVNIGNRNTPRMQCITLKHYEQQLNGMDLYYHTGGAIGVQGYAAFNKDTRDGVVILTIGSDTAKKRNDVNEVCLAMAEHCFGL